MRLDLELHVKKVLSEYVRRSADLSSFGLLMKSKERQNASQGPEKNPGEDLKNSSDLPRKNSEESPDRPLDPEPEDLDPKLPKWR